MSVLEDWQPAADLALRIEATVANCEAEAISHDMEWVRAHHRTVAEGLRSAQAVLKAATSADGAVAALARLVPASAHRWAVEVRAAAPRRAAA